MRSMKYPGQAVWRYPSGMAGFQFTHALVRSLSRTVGHCALTHLARQPIDPALAAAQHQTYVKALAAAGVEVTVLPEEPELPDAVFVEDTAVMLDELIILGWPGHPVRQPEVESIRPILEGIREVHAIHSPGTLEGGDVLALGKILFVGLSSRTNLDGVRQLQSIVEGRGYGVRPVKVSGCLHLKTAMTAATPHLVIANPKWIDLSAFNDLEVLSVPDSEPWGANTLPVNDVLLTPASAPRTGELLAQRGLRVRPVEISELQKAEGGLSCLSLLYCSPTSNRGT